MPAGRSSDGTGVGLGDGDGVEIGVGVGVGTGPKVNDHVGDEGPADPSEQSTATLQVTT